MVQLKNTVTFTAEIEEKKVKLVVDAGVSIELVQAAVEQFKEALEVLLKQAAEKAEQEVKAQEQVEAAHE